MSNLETYQEKALECIRAAGEADEAGERAELLGLASAYAVLPITSIAGISTATTRIKMRKVAAERYCLPRVRLPLSDEGRRSMRDARR